MSESLPSLVTIPDEEPDNQEETQELPAKDKAFLVSNNGWRELSFGGTDGKACMLQAFSPRRQGAAHSIGMKFLNFGPEQVEELQRTGLYDGMFMDSVLAIYLCTRPRSIAEKAIRLPGQIREEALQWMDQHEISIGTARYNEIVEAFSEIVNAIIEVNAAVDETGLSEGDTLGES